MKINTEILAELASIAPVLASLERKNNFSVPENYFIDGLPHSFSIADLAAAALNDSKNKIPFTKPEDADTDLTYLGVMSEILMEPFEHLRNHLAFKVPEHYFEILPTLIINEITGEALLPNQFNENYKHNKYSIPDNYFNELGDRILNKVKSEEAQEFDEKVELNALLKQMQHEPVHLLPEVGYFNNLSNKILEQVAEQPVETKVRSIKPFQRILAIAATLALFLAGAWFLQGNNNNGNFNDQFAQITGQEIRNYIATNSYNFNEELLLNATSNKLQNNLFLDTDLKQEDIEFYLFDIDDNFINDYNNESTIDI